MKPGLIVDLVFAFTHGVQVCTYCDIKKDTHVFPALRLELKSQVPVITPASSLSFQFKALLKLVVPILESA